jgi:hypothetical protein
MNHTFFAALAVGAAALAIATAGGAGATPVDDRVEQVEVETTDTATPTETITATSSTPPRSTTTRAPNDTDTTRRSTDTAESDESGAQTATTDETTEATGGEQDSEQTRVDPESVVAQVDSDLVVLSYGVESGTMSITLRNRGESAKRVTVSEVVEGSTGRFAISRYTLPGESTTTVELDLRRPQQSAGVTLITAESMRSGHGTYLSTGGTVSPPYRSDALGLVGGSAASFIGVIAWKRRKEKKQTEQVREVGGT